MKRIIKNCIIIVVSLYLFVFFITRPNLIILSINEATNVFFYNIFPTLFPFFIFSSFIINYNIITYFHIILKPIFKTIFNMSNNVSMVFILCMITGLPSNAKYVKDLLDQNKINIHDGNILLSYTFFPNPMFIVGTIGFGILGNKRVGFVLLLSIYLTNFILAFLQRNKYSGILYDSNGGHNDRFSIVLKNSIYNAINSLIVILGSVSIFIIIRNIIDMTFSFNSYTNAILNCILELTSGINKIAALNTNLKIKTLLISGALSLPGLSVFSQCAGITCDYDIDYKYIFKYKLVGLIINLIITYNLYIIFGI